MSNGSWLTLLILQSMLFYVLGYFACYRAHGESARVQSNTSKERIMPKTAANIEQISAKDVKSP